MAMKPKTIIARTLKLFSDPAHWTKEEWETEKNGVACYCLDGGLNYVVTGVGVGYRGLSADENQNMYLEQAKEIVLAAIKKSGIGGEKARRYITKWNDARNRTIADVRAVLKAALKAA